MEEKGHELIHQVVPEEITVLDKGVHYGLVKLAPKEICAKDGFIPASNQEWSAHLGRWGSCLQLYELLKKEPELIHQLRLEGITVLHKGVQHGCVKLVKFILEGMFDSDGTCTCTCCLALHGKDPACLTREKLVRTRSEYGSTAVNMAVVSGSPKMVLLLKWAIDEFSPKIGDSVTAEGETYGIRIRESYFNLKCNLERKMGTSREGQYADNANDFGINLGVPDVKDEKIDKIYKTKTHSRKTGTDTLRNKSYSMIPKVYSLIENVLKEDWGADQQMINMLIDRCESDADFEFVPVAHVFLHSLFCIHSLGRAFRLRLKIVMSILVASKEGDEDCEEGSGSMVVALFNILDPH